MTALGSLFTGYGGLDKAVAKVFGAEPAWFSEIEDAPSRILAHHWPDVPNHGDITQIDWDKVEPVDILSGGFPCQDVSAAGKRAGLHPDTRSGLWNHMAYAISKLRPRYVVAENVRGLLSAEAHSDVEPCPWCLGDGPGEPALRALGAVLGDLADLGYDARWCGLRAAEVGAPHGRYRIFVLARDTNSCDRDRRAAAGQQRETGPAAGPAADPDDTGRQQHGRPVAVRPELATTECSGNPAANPGNDRRQGSKELDRRTVGGIAAPLGHNSDGCPDPVADTSSERHGDTWPSGVGGVPAAIVGSTAAHPTRNGRHEGRSESARLKRRPDAAERRTSAVAWGQYGPAVERWERILGRVAPSPTEPNSKGSQRLNPAFVEWMMGLPAGHVTAVPGVNRNAQLKALGNGVVPQQAIAALCHMYTATQSREVA